MSAQGGEQRPASFAPTIVLGEDGLPVADRLLYVAPEGSGAEVRFRLDERGEARLGWDAATVIPAGKHRAFVRDYRDTIGRRDSRWKCFLILPAGERTAKLVADAAPDWALMKDAAAAGLTTKLLDHAEKAT